MLVTNPPSGPASLRQNEGPHAAVADVQEPPPADDEGDEFAAMRGLLLGSALGAACLAVLALAGWWLL